MRYLRIFLIYLKRRLRSKGFICAAVIIPILIPLISSIDFSEDKGFSAGYYLCEDNKDLRERLNSTDGMVKFIEYSSEDSLIRAVENETLNCGYILPEDIFKAIKNNEKGAITCYKSPSSILTELANEALFSELAGLYSADIAQAYLTENNLTYDKEKLMQYYDNYLVKGKAIGIEYSYIDNKLPNMQGSSAKSEKESIYGLIAIYIMLGGILGIGLWIKDEKMFVPFGIMNVAISVFILAVCSLISLAVVKSLDLNIAVRLLLYQTFVTVYCSFIKCVFNKISLICGLLPVLILGSLIICPVFIDITAFVPQLTPLRYLFAPYYFLADIKTLLIGILIFSVFSFSIYKIKAAYL